MMWLLYGGHQNNTMVSERISIILRARLVRFKIHSFVIFSKGHREHRNHQAYRKFQTIMTSFRIYAKKMFLTYSCVASGMSREELLKYLLP